MAIPWFKLLLVICSPLHILCAKIMIGLLLPFEDEFYWSLPRVRPAVEYALESINEEQYLLRDHTIHINYADSKCSETIGPLEAIDMYHHGRAHAFLGPVCSYAVAPIARFSPHWNIPLITPGAMVRAFSDKNEYPLLTRIGGTYTKLGAMFPILFAKFSWTIPALIYHNAFDVQSEKSDCHFLMEAVWHYLRRRFEAVYRNNDIWYQAFDENLRNSYNLTDILLTMSKHARIVILCASPESIRDIMIEAHRLKFDQGDYAFINIDLLGTKTQVEMPWYREFDPIPNNEIAKEAYKSLLTITQRKSDTAAFKRFSDQIKRKAGRYDKYHAEEELNSFAVEFYDALYLYAYALNETLEAGFNISDGKYVTHRMWNRVFESVTGTIRIDENGDRIMDYSLLDFNPKSGKFEVVANIYGYDRTYVSVNGREIHWPNRDSAPPDTPKCGFSGSKCPAKEPFPKYAIVIIVLGSLLVFVCVVAFFVSKHFYLKAKMATYVQWNAGEDGTITTALTNVNETECNASQARSQDAFLYEAKIVKM